jgi:hypothetical protein
MTRAPGIHLVSVPPGGVQVFGGTQQERRQRGSVALALGGGPQPWQLSRATCAVACREGPDAADPCGRWPVPATPPVAGAPPVATPVMGMQTRTSHVWSDGHWTPAQSASRRSSAVTRSSSRRCTWVRSMTRVAPAFTPRASSVTTVPSTRPAGASACPKPPLPIHGIRLRRRLG